MIKSLKAAYYDINSEQEVLLTSKIQRENITVFTANRAKEF